MPERLMGKLPRHGVPRRTFRAAPLAPLIRFDDTTLNHRPVRPYILSDGH